MATSSGFSLALCMIGCAQMNLGVPAHSRLLHGDNDNGVISMNKDEHDIQGTATIHFHQGRMRFRGSSMITSNFSAAELAKAGGIVKGGADDYERLELLGEGSYGAVWKVKAQRTGELLAMKRTALQDNELGENFDHEVDIMEKLKGVPNTVQLYDNFKKSTNGYMVMTLMEGGNLESKIKGDKEKRRENPVQYKTHDTREYRATMKKCMRSVMEALEKMHDRGIVHLDIKPDNIGVGASLDDCIVFDFGLSQEVKLNPPPKKSTPQHHTGAGRRNNQANGNHTSERYNAGGRYLFGRKLYYAKPVRENEKVIATCVGSPGYIGPECIPRYPVASMDMFQLAMTFRDVFWNPIDEGFCLSNHLWAVYDSYMDGYQETDENYVGYGFGDTAAEVYDGLTSPPQKLMDSCKKFKRLEEKAADDQEFREILEVMSKMMTKKPAARITFTHLSQLPFFA